MEEGQGRVPKQAGGERMSLVERLEKEVKWLAQIEVRTTKYSVDYLQTLLQDALDQIRRQ